MTQDRTSVLLLGYGEMGHAMEYLLRPRHDVRIWQRRPPPGAVARDLETEAARADAIVFCVPTAPHAEVAARLKAVLRPHTLIATVAKGLDDTARTAIEALRATLGERQPCAVLYGPMIAEEIRAGRPAFAQAGVREAADFARLQALFRGSRLALEPARDVTGLSWCAVLKNPYAILFGLADGLGLGDNVRGWLAVGAVREMTGVLAQLGGEAATPQHLAGLGDLITTATSTRSRHHELGRELAHGIPRDLGSEGVHTLEVLRAQPRFDAAAFPLFRLVERVVREPGAAVALLHELVGAT
jgi:glycerol-3-phosphate dehydrogenase (NAD(P)+)